MKNNDLTCLSCLIAESAEAYENLKNPAKCLNAARYFVREYCSKFEDKPLEFESFLKWLAARSVYQEYFGLHFVRAWNDEMKRRGLSTTIAFLKADEMYAKHLRHKPFLNCIEFKEAEPTKNEIKKPMKEPAKPNEEPAAHKEKRTSDHSVAFALVFLAIAIIVAAFIIRSRPTPVQHRFQKLNNGEILNVETGEVKTY